MNGHRVAALFRRVTQEIRRDRPSLALLFVAPVLITGLVTFILREGEEPVVDAVVVNEAGQVGDLVISALTPVLVEQGGSLTEVGSEGAARALVEDKTASIAVILPPDLGTGSSPTITLVTNGLDPTGESSQVVALQRALQAATTAALGIALPTIVHETVYGTPSDDPMTVYAPAIVGFFAYFFVYILTGVSFLRERTGGTLERLMATPVRRLEVVSGYTLGFGLFATLQVGVLLLWTLGSLQVPAIGPLPEFSIGLGIPVAGNPLLAYLVVVVTALGAVSLGIFLSTFARTELQVIQFIPIVMVPQFLLSGVLFPISSLPAVVVPFTMIMPMTYAVDGLRQVFIAGADLGTAALQIDLLILTGFALLFAAIASLTIRRDVV
jgi:ABC-2 type transport system permease protein